MKTNLDPTDRLFRKAITSDHPGIEADKAIADRLNYYFMIKRSGKRLQANSFSGMFLWLFSLKGMGVKAGFVSACLAYFLFFGNIRNNSAIRDVNGTYQMQQLLVDTNYVAKDTCK
ncbi:MAG TPA: hypothetical protein VIH57_08125 [Bacteroidales bacterium]